MDSILNSVKKAMGIQEDYTHFDPELIMHTNSTFATLHQLGVGPEKGFFVNDENTGWDAFTNDEVRLNSVKTYVFLKVKLIFDPPPTANGRTSLEEMAKELEWRLNVASENLNS